MGHAKHARLTMIAEQIEIPKLVHFGKYKNWPISEACEDEAWLGWLLENPYVRLGIALAEQRRVHERLRNEEVA